MKELTNKQLQFCIEYLVDKNGTQAAILSGYSKKSATVTAPKLLHQDKIQNELDKNEK